MIGDPVCSIHGFNPCRCHEFPARVGSVVPALQYSQSCPYCGMLHMGTCPRVKSIEYHENGIVKRIEFHDVPSQRTSEQGYQMWSHFCKAEGSIIFTEHNEPCNWCDVEEKDVQPQEGKPKESSPSEVAD